MRKNEQKKNVQLVLHHCCRTEYWCCAFYHPRSNLLTTSFVARQVWCGQMRQLYAYDANEGNESTRRLVEDGKNTRLTNTHTARGVSVLYHVFARKQCILSALRHKSYLTLPYVTSIQDPFCLGTFAHGFIRLPPCSLASSRGCSLTITMNC